MNEDLEKRITELENTLKDLIHSDRYTFPKTIQILDGRNIQVGRGTGTKIGTGADQKIGFFNKTPAVQQTAPSALAESGVDSDATARAAINVIRTALINLGIIA